MKKCIAAYKSGFGFNKKMLQNLKEKTSMMDIFERHGSLLLDEMKLFEHLSIEKSGILQDFVDLSPFTQP